MSDRASSVNLVLSLVACTICLLIVLSAVGFGVGVLEFVAGLALFAVASGLIVRRHRRARTARFRG